MSCALTAVLLLDAGLHGLWSLGRPWPASNFQALSVGLLGFQVPFRAQLLVPLAAALVGAASIVLAAGRSVDGDRWRWLWRSGSAAITSALLLRGIAGLAWCVGVAGYLPPSFYRLNLFLYTPLCLVLGAFGLVLLAPPPSERQDRSPWRRLSLRLVTAAAPVILAAVVGVAAFLVTPTAQTGYGAQEQLKGIPSRYATTSVARFHYIEQGTGSPVVLLSPGAAWLAAWLPQFRALATSHTVYVVDLPGQGFTELRDPRFVFDLDGMTRAIGSFLDKVGVSATVLGGNSWSGGWALAYAQRRPDRVSRLLLLAPSGLDRPDPLGWEMLKIPVVGRALVNVVASSRSMTETGVRGLFAHQSLVTPALVTAMWAPGTLADNVRATYELEARLDWSTTEAQLAATRQPTLIVWGAEDSVLPATRAATFGARMPTATVRVLSGCGHALTLDCPDEVTALMEHFLRAR